jgi:CDGSH-type Zn-finger protein
MSDESISAECSVTVCENGPYLLRGDFSIVTTDGTVVDRERAVVALCRCGHSSLKPLCDGTHALISKGKSD